MRIGRTFLALASCACLAFCLTGCCIQHDWKDANCTYPKTCKECGKTEGEPIGEEGHIWLTAKCETPKTCEVCSKTEGTALGHDWEEQTYYEPKTCKRCGETEGKSLKDETDDLINDLKSELDTGEHIRLKGTIRIS